MTIMIHHLSNSRSQRVLWLLEELELAYGIRRYERDPASGRADPALKQIHPLGKSPVLEDEGSVVVETALIFEYLIEKADGRLGPRGSPDEKLRWRHLLHFAEGSLMGPLSSLAALGMAGDAGAPVRAIIQDIVDGYLDWLESLLADSPWFAGGEFSAADIILSFPLEVARKRAGLDQGRPRLIDWLARIHARPAYRRALAQGGDYAFAE